MSESVNQTPDSIDFSSLQEFADQAREREEVEASQQKEGPFSGLTKDQVVDLVGDKLQEISDLCDHPMAHKAAMALIIDNMVEWHTRVAKTLIEYEDTQRQAIGWARDAGKFQAIYNILSTIEVSDDDFIQS